MPMLFEHQIRFEDHDYKFSVSFDDVAIMADIGRIEIKAERRKTGSEDWESSVIKAEIHRKEEVLLIICDNRKIAEIPLGDIAERIEGAVPESVADTDPQTEIENLEVLLDKVEDGDLVAEITEKVLEHFPADPIIGCLVKGLASTVIGQLIRCWFPRRDIRPVRELLEGVGGCLDGNKLAMLKTFVWRTGWCMARCGI